MSECMKRKKRIRKFRPFKNPRYLPGDVKKAVWKADLKTFNNHRYAVWSMKERVDHFPLPMNPTYYLKTQRMTQDAIRLREIDKHNKELIKKINVINRMGGKVDSFNPIAYAYKSKWRAHELKMREIDRHNKEIYKKIMQASSIYAVKETEKFWKYVIEKLKYMCKYPIFFLGNKTLDQLIREQPSITGEEETVAVDRPKVFMDFRVKGGVYLGRIIIELYHDYVPVTVQNFVSICCKEDNLTYKNCPVHRVAPNQYIATGDIIKGNGKGGTSIYGDTFAEENHVLKHTKPGVLSAIRVGEEVNNSQFLITTAAMEKLDNQNVVFGHVIIGNKTLCKINDLGRPFGSPVAPIIICNCGKFISGETPTVLKVFKYVKCY